ncbi:MAG: hypothetical protein GYA24_21105 [Candidatus Lokiarchaeota archaeon]|nr:hypothetical protein [Candidatus Lokiarchaeota archaeon]
MKAKRGDLKKNLVRSSIQILLVARAGWVHTPIIKAGCKGSPANEDDHGVIDPDHPLPVPASIPTSPLAGSSSFENKMEKGCTRKENRETAFSPN